MGGRSFARPPFPAASVPSTQAIQRNRNRAAVISSASPSDRASSWSPSNARGGRTASRIPLVSSPSRSQVPCIGPRNMLPTSSSVATEGAKPAFARVAVHRSKTSLAAARSPWFHVGADQRLPCTLVYRINEQQALRRNDRGVGFVLLGQDALRHRAGMSGEALLLVPEPMIERRIEPDEIIQERPLKQFQTFRIANGCLSQQADINPEPIVEQHEVIAIRLQPSGVRPESDPQFMHRLAERRPRLLALASAPEQSGQSRPQHLSRPGKRQHSEHRTGLA